MCRLVYYTGGKTEVQFVLCKFLYRRRCTGAKKRHEGFFGNRMGLAKKNRVYYNNISCHSGQPGVRRRKQEEQLCI